MSKRGRGRTRSILTAEDAYLTRIVPNAARIQGRPYGEIATITGLTRIMVKQALQWGINNDHTRVIEGPTSRPGDNVVEINLTPTLRGTKTDAWNRQYIQTRTTNKLLNTAKQKAATETDPIIKPLHEAAVAQAETALSALRSQAAIQNAIATLQSAGTSGGASSSTP